MRIETETDIEKLCSEIYGALDQKLESDILDEWIRKLETCRFISRKEKNICQDVNIWLLALYTVQKRTYEACQLIAEYEMNICEIGHAMKQERLPQALRDRGMDGERLLFQLLHEQMIASNETYDEYYKLFENYPSGEYAQLLILYARKEDRRTDTIVLSNSIGKLIRQKQTRGVKSLFYMGVYTSDPLSQVLSYYTERLEDLSYTRDYAEIRKCVNEAKRQYDYDKDELLRFSPECLPRFWINMMHCLNLLERYDKVIWLSGTIGIKMTDPDYYLYLAQAYYAQNQLEEARKNCKRSAGLGADQNNLLLLAQIMFTKREYRVAEKLLLQSIAMMSPKVESFFIDRSEDRYSERTVIREIHPYDFRQKLESPYTLLFLCYVYEENYVKAKAFYEEIKEKLGSSEMVMISGCLLQVNEKAEGKLCEIRQEQKTLREQFEQASKENRMQRALLRQWTSLLVECQLEDERFQVTTDYWEENLADRMEHAIQRISEIVKNTNAAGYQAEETHVREVFPKIPEEAVKFLASAEQMYKVFKGNRVIDFAPVMVEYCKVIEVVLWSWLERTGEYDDEIANNQNKLKTLGTAMYVIRKGGAKKSLFDFCGTLEVLTNFRNKSAHKEMSKEPDVDDARALIWDSGFVQKLCS